MKVLVIDDDRAVADCLREGLRTAGHSCIIARDGRSGLDAASSQQFDLAILELVLPRLGGMDLLCELRARGIQMPVIVMTAEDSLERRVSALSRGADDYLAEPFALEELIARAEAVRRRTAARPAAVVRVGDLTLDLSTRRVTRGGRQIALTPTQFSLLELLMRHAGQVVTRRMLCEHLWNMDSEGPTNVTEVHVNRLRRKLDKGFDHSAIRTVRGYGYAICHESCAKARPDARAAE